MLSCVCGCGQEVLNHIIVLYVHYNFFYGILTCVLSTIFVQCARGLIFDKSGFTQRVSDLIFFNIRWLNQIIIVKLNKLFSFVSSDCKLYGHNSCMVDIEHRVCIYVSFIWIATKEIGISPGAKLGLRSQ